MNTLLLSNSSGYFITGTDTGVGKTTISCLLLNLFAKQGKNTLGLKPVATGCYNTPEGNRSEDGELLQQHSSLKLPYSHINPIALTPPTSPNIAAVSNSLTVKGILNLCQPALSAPSDFLIIEGAGGWKVPINQTETMADLALSFKLPIILVVGVRLGCINHTLLSVESIQKSGAQLAGWIANEIEPGNPFWRENLKTICQHLNMPLLASVSFQEKQLNLNSAVESYCERG